MNDESNDWRRRNVPSLARVQTSLKTAEPEDREGGQPWGSSTGHEPVSEARLKSKPVPPRRDLSHRAGDHRAACPQREGAMFGKAWELGKESVTSFINDGALSRGAAIAFYTVTSIGPVLLIVVAIAGLAFGQDAARGAIVSQLSGLMGQQSAELLQNVIRGASGSPPVSSPAPWESSVSTAWSLMPVMVDFMLVQVRCIEPLMEPPCAGSPPRPRTLASSSAAPSAQRRAAVLSSAFRLGVRTPSAHVRKPRDHVLIVHRKFLFFEPPRRRFARGIPSRRGRNASRRA